VADVLSQDGRTAIITGANSGLGLETAARLAQAGARTVLACRSEERAGAAREEILARHPEADVEVLRLDLADLGQVADAAAEAIDRFGAIHLCVNNAGIIGRSRTTTVDGFETTFAVNHLGHVAWTAHLLPAVLTAPDSRIVTVSSLAHLKATMDWDDLQGERSFKPTVAYRRSKLANLLHSAELQRRLATAGHRTVAVAAHPGIAASNFWKTGAGPSFAWVGRAASAVIGVLFNTTAQGARPVVHAATAPGIEPGRVYGPRIAQRWGDPDVVAPSDAALDAESAARLWAISEELTGVETDL
jgi:NAD(P)-dependent dehydrogenase (short-subunit alcohol dehydrogenase family)